MLQVKGVDKWPGCAFTVCDPPMSRACPGPAIPSAGRTPVSRRAASTNTASRTRDTASSGDLRETSRIQLSDPGRPSEPRRGSRPAGIPVGTAASYRPGRLAPSFPGSPSVVHPGPAAGRRDRSSAGGGAAVTATGRRVESRALRAPVEIKARNAGERPFVPVNQVSTAFFSSAPPCSAVRLFLAFYSVRLLSRVRMSGTDCLARCLWSPHVHHQVRTARKSATPSDAMNLLTAGVRQYGPSPGSVHMLRTETTAAREAIETGTDFFVISISSCLRVQQTSPGHHAGS